MNTNDEQIRLRRQHVPGQGSPSSDIGACDMLEGESKGESVESYPLNRLRDPSTRRRPHSTGLARKAAKPPWLVTLALMLILAIAMPTAAASNSSAADGSFLGSPWAFADRGLGNYGPEGPIDREDLPNPYVSDRTIQVASSSRLADVRSRWNEPYDFVNQVGYQLEFRALSDYLNHDVEHIAHVLDNRASASAMGLHELGLFMTDSEWQETRRRAESWNRAFQVRAALVGEERAAVLDREAQDAEFGPIFGGMRMDNLNGGIIQIGVVGSPEISGELVAAMEAAPDVELISVTYSWDQLREWSRVALNAAIDQDVNATASRSVQLNAVIVTVDSDRYQLPEIIPKDAALVRVDPEYVLVQPHHEPDSAHPASEMSSGLRARIGWTGWELCTWGMAGHTYAYNYLVTAGHCVLDNNNETLVGWHDVNVRQEGSGQWMQGIEIAYQPNAYVVAKDIGRIDAARIMSHYGDTNCYHGQTAWCAFSMDSRRSLYGHAEGQTVCASYAGSNIYLCTYITSIEENTEDPSALVLRTLKINGVPHGGDSGSGVKYSNTWDGLHYAGSTTHGVVTPAYYVKTDLGFDFNCVPHSSNPSGWGACPYGDPN